MSNEVLVQPEEDAVDVESADATSANAWVVRLGIAAVLICAVTAGLFYFTSRSVFARAASAAASSAGGMPVMKVDPMSKVVSLEHGLAVYATNCAMCHGANGLGDGPAVEPPPPAPPLMPKPRNFSGGSFKLGTTKSGLPTDDDLAATIRHGMLPAPMPPWPQLSEGELKSVVMAVRHLAIEGRVAEKLERDSNFPREKALQMAHAQLDPGPVIVLPPKKPEYIDLERGKAFYTANCAACHDPDGRGKLRTDLVDNDENPILPRDFTMGQFKGGKTIDDIALRIVRGIPGSPMPTNPEISAADLWSTAAYVHAFIRTEVPTVGAAAVRPVKGE
jgi:mono/diheme cytochrome c family protein